MEFREHRLANGLSVVAECNPRAYSAAVGFFVQTGSRDETDDVWGVSHFLEHMVFRGTARRSAEDVNRELDELGSMSNAYTSEEQTVYYAAVLPEYVDRAVELLSDLMRPSLRESDFNVEKDVIIKEIVKYDTEPPFGAHERAMAAHFGSHPLGRSVLGTVESITAMTPERMRAYFDRRYSPGNMALVASGNIDFPRLVALAEQHCGGWQSFATHRDTPRAAPHEGFESLTRDIATNQYMIKITNGPAAADPDRYAGRILATVVGDDTGSRMFWELVDTGLADFAGMSTYEYQGTGIFMSFLCCSPEEAESNRQIMSEIEQDVEASGITEAELTQAKNKICSSVVLQAERPGNRLFSVGNAWLQRREYRTVREVVNAYQAVTLDDVRRLLANYPLSRGTTITVGPAS